MTHFSDLTTYSYGAVESSEASARNVGWLTADIEFPTSPADPQFVERLWRFCKVSIGQTRGLHECDLCHSREASFASRNGEKLLLGSAEIRVFSADGGLYAAPNLIYHYVTVHNYSPPAEFVRSVLAGLSPPDEMYFAALSKLGFGWSSTLVPEENAKSIKFVRTPQGVVKIEE